MPLRNSSVSSKWVHGGQGELTTSSYSFRELYERDIIVIALVAWIFENFPSVHLNFLILEYVLIMLSNADLYR